MKKTINSNQYKNADNLNARIKLHEKFSVNKCGFHEWVFNEFNLKEGMKVLEIGCGPGAIWYKNYKKLPKNIDITLVDLSEGMLEAAKKNIKLVTSINNFNFVNSDIQNLPFEDKTFDIVIANHMLYHVTQIDKGISEIKRVLKDTGFFYASTFSKQHLKEIDDLTRLFVDIKKNRTSDRFCIENGEKQIKRYFNSVKLKMHDDRLEITESTPLIEYILSGSKAKETLVDYELIKFKRYIKEVIFKEKVFHVRKKAGVFIAKK